MNPNPQEQIALKTNVEISPLVFALDDYERQRREGFPLIPEIERDMVRL